MKNFVVCKLSIRQKNVKSCGQRLEMIVVTASVAVVA
jgi:hypothetical protein